MSRSPSTLLSNRLKEKLASGGLALSLIVKHVAVVDIALVAKACDYDAINVDLEHSVITEAAAAQISIAAHQLGVTPLVRVPSHDAHYANRMLDAGAMGIVVPHVSTAEEARRVVRACRFSPLGERSVAGSWPQLAYESFPADSVRRAFNDATIVIVMLETPDAVGRAEEIAAVPGVDILHVGATDLCDAMGIPGRLDDPRIKDAFRKVVDACQVHGKHAGGGGLGGDSETLQEIVRLGVRFVTAGNEWAFMIAGAKKRAELLRRIVL